MPLSPSIEPLESRIAPAFAAVFELFSLDGSNGFKVNGVAADDFAGTSVSDAGDVNGDGFADFVIGAPNVRVNGTYSGACYVVFGKANGIPAELDLSALDGSNGFKISGARASRGQVAAGDVNHDGFSDLIIGDSRASPNGTGSGATYIIFGKANGFQPDLDVSTLNGANGFRISGAAANDQSGSLVNDAGDVNGDGVDDMIIAATKLPYTDLITYVVFGKTSGFASELDLSTINGTNGFKFLGNRTDLLERLTSVSGAGDINRDGFDDVIIGGYHTNGVTSTSYVVFGTDKGFAAVLDSSALNGTNGFRISGAPGTEHTGYSVSAAGDINGDGFDDAIIGVYHADTIGALDSGACYVIFGKADVFASDLNLAELNGSNGFRVSGAASGDRFGFSVHGGGDVNGDRHDDIIIGAITADPHGSNSGASYVIFGKPSGFGSNLNVSTLDGSNGFKLNGVAADDSSGRAVSTAGDINGDGFDDMIISSSQTDPNGMLNAGSIYVVFGQGTGSPLISIGDASLTEGNADATEMTFLVTLSSASTDPVTVQFSTVDGTAHAGGDYAALDPGTLTFAPGETTKTITVNLNVDTLYEADENFSVILSNPSGAALGHATGLGTILNDDTVPVMSIAGDTVLEGTSGASSLTFSVSLSAASGLPVTVNYTTADGTAKAGSDYIAPGLGTLTFAPGETTNTLTIKALGDSGIEDHEQFSVILSGAGGATIGSGTAAGMILNDDTAIRISDASAAEGDSGTTPFSFIVTLAKASALPVTINYATTDGTATGGSDFTVFAPDSQLTFAPGEISKTITVDVHGDTDGEADETFFVVLPEATNASLADATGTGTILDEDAPPRPSVRIDDASVLEGHSGARSMIFTVTLSVEYPLPVSVDFASTNGTAMAGADYTAFTPGSLQFAPGETSKTISVDVIGDTTVEARKTFSVVLSNPVNVIIEDANGVGTILDDDVTLVSPREATYNNPNGDLVTIKVSNGALKVEDFTIMPRGAGSELAQVDFSGQTEFAGAKLSITARTPNGSAGNGLSDVGYINASGIDLGKVTISGDLGQIDCGDANASKPALKALTVSSLGARGLSTQVPGPSASLHSDIDGDLGKLKVNGGISSGSALAVGGRLGSATIRGDIDAAVISALGLLNSRNPADALAIGKLTIAGSIAHSQILAGYDLAGAATNADVSVGAIVVNGNWMASDLVVGVSAGLDGLFGDDTDTLIPGGNAAIIATISKLIIKGEVFGTLASGDQYGILAEQIRSVSIGKTKLDLKQVATDEIAIGTTGDFLLREVT